jgi:hypothetical protein
LPRSPIDISLIARQASMKRQTRRARIYIARCSARHGPVFTL